MRMATRMATRGGLAFLAVAWSVGAGGAEARAASEFRVPQETLRGGKGFGAALEAPRDVLALMPPGGVSARYLVAPRGFGQPVALHFSRVAGTFEPSKIHQEYTFFLDVIARRGGKARLLRRVQLSHQIASYDQTFAIRPDNLGGPNIFVSYLEPRRKRGPIVWVADTYGLGQDDTLLAFGHGLQGSVAQVNFSAWESEGTRGTFRYGLDSRGFLRAVEECQPSQGKAFTFGHTWNGATFVRHDAVDR